MVEVDSEELQTLVYENDLEGILRRVPLSEIARRFSARLAEPREHDDDGGPDFWTWDMFTMPAIWQSSETLRTLIRLIVDCAPNDFALSVIGAGPLEDFVSADEADLVWIEEQAVESPAFRKALGNVWLGRGLPAEAMARLDRAAGSQLRRPPPE